MKPRLLDLFCGAGGAARGYERAGFHVVGVDVVPQPRYMGDEFVLADAMTFDLSGYDAIHASPPCQSYSRACAHLAAPKPMLVPEVRGRLTAAGVPWVIENVPGAPLTTASDMYGSHGVILCGTAFGLRVKRHRLFETSFPVAPRECDHEIKILNPHWAEGRLRIYAEFGRCNPEKKWIEAMGVEWMTQDEAAEAIPPAFTEHIGRALIAALSQPASARGESKGAP